MSTFAFQSQQNVSITILLFLIHSSLFTKNVSQAVNCATNIQCRIHLAGRLLLRLLEGRVMIEFNILKHRNSTSVWQKDSCRTRTHENVYSPLFRAGQPNENKTLVDSGRRTQNLIRCIAFALAYNYYYYSSASRRFIRSIAVSIALDRRRESVSEQLFQLVMLKLTS